MIKLTTISIYYNIFRSIWASDFCKSIINETEEVYTNIFNILRFYL